MRTILIIVSSLMLTACVIKEPGSIKTVLLYPPIPYELLNCPIEPPLDDGIQTPEWVDQVRKSGHECRVALSGLRAFIYSWEADIDMKDPWWAEGDDF